MDYKEFFINDNKSGWKCVEKKLRNKYPCIHELIINFSDNNNLDDLPFKQKVYHFIHDLTSIPKCKICGKELKFGRSISEGYGVYCSKICSNLCDDRKDKIVQTNLKIYNCKYSVLNDEVREKIKKTNIERYNVENVFSSPEIKDKIVQTNLKIYGFNRPLKNKDIEAKRKATCINKFNVSTPLLLKENKEKANNKKYVDFYEKYNFLDIKSVNNGICNIKCDKCGEIYEINTRVLFHRVNLNIIICTLCNPIGNFKYSEGKITSYLDELNIKYDNNRRDLMCDSKEIDIFIPDKNIGIEYDGLIWHSNIYVDKLYHLNKTKNCNKNNIDLIHIFEDEWVYKEDIIKGLVKEFLLIDEINVNVKDISIKNIDMVVTRNFMECNNLNGFKQSNINIGLTHNNKLVTVMSFNHDKINNTYILERFSNDINFNIKNSYRLLLDYFIKKYNPIKIITVVDNRYLFGKKLSELGFNRVNSTPPNKWFLIKYNKDRFYRRSDTNSNKKDLNVIYDCGCSGYEFNLSLK